jgi:hypothetical protein
VAVIITIASEVSPRIRKSVTLVDNCACITIISNIKYQINKIFSSNDNPFQEWIVI